MQCVGKMIHCQPNGVITNLSQDKHPEKCSYKTGNISVLEIHHTQALNCKEVWHNVSLPNLWPIPQHHD